ncbi:MAG: MFS transporter [Pseudolysinimonas sp.]|uniref:MFS transporter n=1 Tax=Pseudolysinimonas sp. TaxID=2680009 RepID=UPI0032645E4F
MTVLTDEDVARIRRRSHVAIIAGQALAGIGMGATFSSAALLAGQLSGSPAWSGTATTMSTLGAAAASIPLAALARRSGRSPALATGAGIAALGAVVGIFAVALDVFPLFLLAMAMLGVGTAVNLQSRFAATDLSEPGKRGRDLAVVVWATTIGAVVGPNLIGPGDSLGRSFGLPALGGVFIFTIAAQAVASLVYLFALRPDPLRTAQRLGVERASATVSAAPENRAGVRTGILTLALSHATMASVMAMTPVHLVDHGATLVIVGLTISLHVAGMYGLSPVWGILSDRFGREPVIALGQGMLLAGLLMASFGSESSGWVLAGLIALGLGWSASTVAASGLVADSAGSARRTIIQGRADLSMSLAGAVGAGGAGVVLSFIGYAGLALSVTALVAVVLGALAIRTAGQRSATD